MVKWESFNAITCNGKRHISPRYVSSGCRSIWFLELVLEEIAFSMGDLEALLLVEVMLVQNQHDTWRCILSPDAIYNHLVTKFASHMQNIQDSNPILGNFGTVLPLWKCLFFLGDYLWINCQLVNNLTREEFLFWMSNNLVLFVSKFGDCRIFILAVQVRFFNLTKSFWVARCNC